MSAADDALVRVVAALAKALLREILFFKVMTFAL